MKRKTVFAVNLTIFSLILILHLFRAVTGFYVKFWIWEVPVWINYLAVLLAAFLIYINYQQWK